ncbi:hypothetical protein G5C51_04685 [Streptomyces sp. A7024]|uniref:Uncharacterized protein n=1 Tax=Streptomyces coryli TaxID=1128680 RepID=A0A6G4TT94_9ACTN|nr:hypothetical protein [Streptomyces coryli]NGN63205.1 hypothetical protein [Streptomyces coryli]
MTTYDTPTGTAGTDATSRLREAVERSRTLLIAHAPGTDPLPLLYALGRHIGPEQNLVTVSRGRTGTPPLDSVADLSGPLVDAAPQLLRYNTGFFIVTPVRQADVVSLLRLTCSAPVGMLGTLALPPAATEPEKIAEHLLELATNQGLYAQTAAQMLSQGLDYIAYLHHRPGGVAALRLYTVTDDEATLQLTEAPPTGDITNIVRGLGGSTRQDGGEGGTA